MYIISWELKENRELFSHDVMFRCVKSKKIMPFFRGRLYIFFFDVGSKSMIYTFNRLQKGGGTQLVLYVSFLCLFADYAITREPISMIFLLLHRARSPNGPICDKLWKIRRKTKKKLEIFRGWRKFFFSYNHVLYLTIRFDKLVVFQMLEKNHGKFESFFFHNLLPEQVFSKISVQNTKYCFYRKLLQENSWKSWKI